ncbi:carbohydrate binding family 9 domain-containing protein [Kordia sp. YSTF-M3]|uniref:Carbohydrate binding family 9 domain-containing protein n=1 Tax=Kordia aestuariivivens TaxID=2759037 RepID=A0ABR7QFV9_9FLAO|nr:DUF5916 domain-containing protein [Kordia aestuariivivens]MBC8757452.1 carbohydrate binding family 9 domain-containing protein [Kordia aestuariivivens]
MRITLTLCFVLLLSFITNAQNKKQLAITRTDNAPKIDGILDDEVWKTAQEATGFTQFRPDVGVTDTEANKTVVKMTYDDTAIYVSAYLYDDPEKIMRQFTSRDNFGQSDFFALVLNPNNDAQNDTQFFVFSSGTQADAIANPSIGEDFGWNAVWDSAVQINDDGWSLEMKIPYRTLRFSNREVQTWGLQFHRQFRRFRSQYTWSPIDVTKGNIGLYHGELTGLKNIEPPTRLTFYPFTTGISNSFDGQSESDFKLGLDVKYGITENFTLDMTLIPDFSQAGFDNLELNLGPFEQTFSEQRQFFTEGVDLFNKGNLFFSRRVGGGPSGSVELAANEEITQFPNTVKVINAAKVSGRTKKGLGIGVFNAVTEKTNASIRNTDTGDFRDEVVEPLTNYNIIVLDQQFNGNSSVSLINTNVMREGDFRDANVTGLLADITNKRNTYNVRGQVKMSNVNELDGTTTGFSSFFMVRKVHGNYRYSFDHSYADNKYNINDLGLQFRNNFNNFGIDASYRTFKPTEKLNNYFIGTYVNYRRLANPSTYTGGNGGVNFDAQTKTLHNFGGNINYNFGKRFDYFEPRQEGRFFISEDRVNSNVWVSTNYNNTFAFDANIGGATFFEKGRDSNSIWFGFSPRVQISDKFIISYSIDADFSNKDRGYTSTIGDDIIFGQRDRKTLVNRLNANYNFNPFHSLGLTFRNYWSTVTYENDLFTLLENGRLDRTSGYEVGDLENNPNINFSTWNLDLSYSWQFAPGSFLTALYRNQLFNSDNASEEAYFSALNTLFEQPIQHTFSLRLQYFIDYNDVKQLLRNKKRKNINS